jgi:hypothetical protein
MIKLDYTFTVDCSPELAKQLNEAFTQRPVLVCEDPEVLKGICEILWRHEFRPFHNGMVRESTGCNFSWECLLKYKTVVDFQLDWPYS